MPNDEQVVLEPELSLADFKKARNEGVKVQAPVVEEPVKEEPEKEVEEQEEPKTEEKPKQKGWNGAQKKIDRLIKHNAELEKRAEAAEKRAAEIEAAKGKEPAKPKADDEPKEEDFNGDTMAFLKAQARWEVRQELKAQEEKNEKEQQDAEAQAIFDAHNETISAARAKYDDFDEVLNSTKTPWKDGVKAHVYASQALNVAVVESGIGGEILYYLAQHPEELNKMVDYTPAKVTLAIGRIADKLEAKEEEPEEEEQEERVVKTEKKPLPMISPVGRGTSTTSKKLEELPLAEYKKARNAGRIR